jgi:hypothetical protein
VVVVDTGADGGSVVTTGILWSQPIISLNNN